jgi:hypothetical protein
MAQVVEHLLIKARAKFKFQYCPPPNGCFFRANVLGQR